MIHMIVSGAGGQLGKAMLERLSFRDGFSVFSFDKGQLDIADHDKLKGILATLPKTKYWINCAAFTKVDEAEKNPEAAALYNVAAPGYIAAVCKDAGIHLIDFSSDYVYHNTLRRPLLETDPTAPKSVYAQSKLKGEQAIRQSGVSHTIIRTSWVYGPHGHNFVNTMLRLGASRNHLRIVSDQLGAPTFTYDIADAVKTLITLRESSAPKDINGTFNFANAGEVTWDNFARTIFKYAGMDVTVESISTVEYAAPAPRPSYSVLDCSKITALLQYPIPSWEDALHRYLAMLR